MAQALGEKIGQGAFADVHAWAPGQVVKLLREGQPRRSARYEARLTRAVFAAGLPAPQVLDEVTVDGRHGIVLTRFDGPTLKALTVSGAVSFGEAGAILAGLAHAVHRTRPPADVFALRDVVEASVRIQEGRLPPHVAAGVLAHIERLGPGDGLCHGDLHADNVIMTAAGPRLIDWTGALRAPALLDLAFSHVLLVEIAAEGSDNPRRPRAVWAAMRAEYARLERTTLATLKAAIRPWLPVARTQFLLGGATGPRRYRALRRIEKALRAEDLP